MLSTFIIPVNIQQIMYSSTPFPSLPLPSPPFAFLRLPPLPSPLSFPPPGSPTRSTRLPNTQAAEGLLRFGRVGNAMQLVGYAVHVQHRARWLILIFGRITIDVVHACRRRNAGDERIHGDEGDQLVVPAGDEVELQDLSHGTPRISSCVTGAKTWDGIDVLHIISATVWTTI